MIQEIVNLIEQKPKCSRFRTSKKQNQVFDQVTKKGVESSNRMIDQSSVDHSDLTAQAEVCLSEELNLDFLL